jgi:hypothetical protein
LVVFEIMKKYGRHLELGEMLGKPAYEKAAATWHEKAAALLNNGKKERNCIIWA